MGVGVVAAFPQNGIPVTVMNNSELPVKLFAGTRIGALSPVRIEEEHPDVNTVTANLPPPPKVPKQGPAAVNLNSCGDSIRKTSSNNCWMSIEMSLLTMIQKLAEPTELSFASIP